MIKERLKIDGLIFKDTVISDEPQQSMVRFLTKEFPFSCLKENQGLLSNTIFINEGRESRKNAKEHYRNFCQKKV